MFINQEQVKIANKRIVLIKVKNLYRKRIFIFKDILYIL